MMPPMNRAQRRRRHQLAVQFNRKLSRYIQALAAAGFDDREIVRTAYYVQRFGFDAVESERKCVVFGLPNCGDENCVNPEHQVLKYE